MTEIPIPTGPTNKEIIDLAYLGLGLSDAMFGRTDDEYAGAMVLLRAMMGEYPFDQIGYDMTEARLDEKSNIAAKWLTAVAYSLTERLASATNKPVPANTAKVKANAFSRLCSGVNVTPAMTYAQGTPAGSGRRWNSLTYATDAI